ncbi:glycosyltransferase family 4 protein [Methylobacterium sp. BTF04]|uniref:glycosyltransferase family 4 protein n=1 Tax=Methylobacterium sp. BTF04 TaxID=2708300 RepID=UPI0013D7858F|nr:glycosyltransferase family 4 protein [Methylobacterium sp. BTF04]NEU11687.1 glycosyltransferase family 4 protein [Methylobacterium sp. BTF04]
MPAIDARRPGPVVILVGALAPYTHRLYERVAAELNRPLHVLACTAREAARQWELPGQHAYRFEVLPGLRWYRSALSNVYLNPAVLPRLRAIRPSVLIVNDFAPTMLLAAAFAKISGVPYGVRTDGVPETDPGLHSLPHRLVRRALLPAADFGIGASEGSRALFAAYGLDRSRTVVAPLFPAWEPEAPIRDEPRPYDLLFCGMLNDDVKGARFFTDVVLGCRERGRALSVRVAGDGPLRAEMEGRFVAAGITAHFDGFVQQQDLRSVYASARLFLFPSRGDVWGIVVQEALQSGTAVLASPHSGAARELLEPYACGMVHPLVVETWVEAVFQLLDDSEVRAAMGKRAQVALDRFSLATAADAYRQVLRTERR